ncbi:hypothetical protein HOI71_21800, partial [Candidatus Poribacteria bacterium]|nr:hypothetical protein [Candidatus Poribacteria bacterium]
SSGGNPIHYAAQGKHVDICRMLVEAGAVDATVDAGDPDVLATFRAAYAYDADALAALLAADPKLATTRDKDGRTPMHEASTGGAIDVIRAFIDAGADVTATDDDGETPLDRAAAHGHGDVVRLLVDAGAAADIFVAVKFSMLPEARAALEADPSQANAEFHGHAIVEHAAEAGLVEMGALLAEFGADIDIHAAASFGMAERVAEGLDGDATLVNATRPMGDYAPLHAAAECGHVDVVRLLLERGADVNQRNAWGFRPLHLSVLAARGFAPTEAHLEITRALITQGAEVAVVDDYDRSALTLAEGHWEKGPIEEALIALLREQGATTV